MHHPNALDLLAALKARKLSARELASQAIERIEAEDGRINAVVVRDFEQATAAAGAADEALARGDERPLLGLPITVKEAFNVAGLPTSWGMPSARGAIAAQDAVVVARLRAAGAIILGKTNVPAMLADWQCGNPLYGTTSNPWNLAFTPGGSSGGGAAALAAGFVSLEFGSDLAASLRAPAAFCGVCAHKPSYGLVPLRGFAPPGAPDAPIAPAIDLSVVGPMARSIADLECALDITAGPDAPMDVAWRIALPPARHDRLEGYRVLVLDDHPALPTAAAIRRALHDRAADLAGAGCQVSHASPLLPDLLENSVLFVELLLSQFTAETSDEAFAAARAAADNPGAGLDPLASAALRAQALSHRDWVRADRRRRALAIGWRALFDEFDVVLCPAMPTLALPKHGASGPPASLNVDGTDFPYNSQPLWAAVATVAGLPATVIPLRLDSSGLPVGAQVIGPYLEDRTPLRFARLMEKRFGGFQALGGPGG